MGGSAELQQGEGGCMRDMQVKEQIKKEPNQYRWQVHFGLSFVARSTIPQSRKMIQPKNLCKFVFTKLGAIHYN